ncbi:MAG: hypothetical protein ACYCQI_14805 [Gammaproteobacteria bacterium]
MSITRKLERAKKIKHHQPLKKRGCFKIDISATMAAAIKPITNTCSSIVSSLSHGAKYVVSSINNRKKDLTKILYYTLYGDILGMYSTEAVATWVGIGISEGAYSRTKTALVTNEQSCWEGIDPDKRIGNSCHNNLDLERQFRNASHLASMEAMPSLNSYALQAFINGGVVGSAAGFLFGILMVLKDHGILQATSQKLTSLVRKVDTTLHGNDFPLFFWAGLFAPTFLCSIISNGTELELHASLYAVKNVFNYPLCNITFSGRAGCEWISCSDKQMKDAFCDAALDYAFKQLPFRSIRQIPMMFVLFGTTSAREYLQDKMKQQAEDKSEKKDEKCEHSAVSHRYKL